MTSAVVSEYGTFDAGSIDATGTAICAGSNNVLPILSTGQAYGGNGAITYLWKVQVSSDGGETFGDPQTATGSTDYPNNELNYTPAAYTGTPGVYLFRRLAKDEDCRPEGEYADGYFVLVVNANPTVSISGASQDPYCPNSDPVTLTANASGDNSTSFTYTWNGDLVAASTEDNTATYNLPAQCGQTYSIGVSVTDNNGCTATATAVSLAVNDQTAPTITLNTNNQPALTLHDGACEYLIPNYLEAQGFVTVDQSCSNVTLTQNPLPGISLPRGASQQITITATGACSTTDHPLVTTKTFTVTTPAAMTVVTDPSTITVCENTAATFNAAVTNANGTVTYRWPDITGHTTAAADNNNFSYVPTHSGLYTVYVKDADGCDQSATVNVTVHTAPADVNLNCPGTIQYNTNGTVSVRPLVTGETITWDITNGTGSATFVGETTSNTVTVLGGSVGDVVVTATITKTGNLDDCLAKTETCNLNIAQNVMTVNCPGDKTKTYDGTALSFNATEITVTDANDQSITDYTLTYSTDGQNFTDTPPTITNAGTVQVTVKATHPQYSENTCQFTMTVNPRPVTLTLTKCAAWTGNQMVSNLTAATATENSGLVTGHAVSAGTVTTNQSTGGEYHYSSTSTSNTANVAGLVISDGTNDVTSNYSVTLTTTQTILQARINHDIVNNTCPLQTGNYTFNAGLVGVTPSSEASYAWSYKEDGATEQTATGTSLNIPADGECHTYTVSVTVTEGSCTSNTEPVTINSVDNDDPIIQSYPPTVVALPNNGTGVTPNCSYLIPDVVSQVVAQDNCTPTDKLTIAQLPTAGTVVTPDNPTITVTVTDKCGKTAEQTVTVTLPEALALTAPPSTAVTCHDGQNGTVTVTAATGGTAPYPYDIYNSNSETVGTWNEETMTFSGLLAGTYTVQVTDANGCLATNTVTVNNIEALTATTENKIICYGGHVDISVTPGGGSGNYKYLWSNNATDRTVTVEPTAAGITEYTVTVSDFADETCTTTAVCTVNVRAPFTAGAIATTGQSVCFGATTGFDKIGSPVKAFGGDSVITYQWYFDGAPIANATDSIYTPNVNDGYTLTAGTHTFTRKAKDGTCNTAFEQSAGEWLLTVYPDVVLAFADPDDSVQTVCSGTDIDPIEIEYENAEIEIQWEGDVEPAGIVVYGSTITGVPTLTGTQPETYRYTVTAVSDEETEDGENPVCAEKTITGRITVRPLPELTLASGSGALNQAVCSGENLADIVFENQNSSLSINWTNGAPAGISTDNFTTNKTISGAPTLTRSMPTR